MSFNLTCDEGKDKVRCMRYLVENTATPGGLDGMRNRWMLFGGDRGNDRKKMKQ